MAKKRRKSDRCEPLRTQLEDIDSEISSIRDALADPDFSKAQKAALRRLLAAYTASEDLIRIGAYQKGSDPTLDKALTLIPELHRFLMQKSGEAAPLAETTARLLALPS